MGDDGAGGGAAAIGEAVALARRFVALRHPAAEAALLAGSRAAGAAGPRSDYDVLLLFPRLPEGAWREKMDFEGRPFELFAHDPGTLSYFCREVVTRSGLPALPEMIVEGIPLTGEGGAALAAARSLAARALAAGPPPLDETAMRNRRYVITEAAEAVANCRSVPALTAAGAALYQPLADFALRAAGRWSASARRLPGALEAMDAALAGRFEAAFRALFAAADPGPVLALADEVLAPYGGRLREGFRRASPPGWRDRGGAWD